jgi:uncharacterized protein YoaH (UPF0181 family)
MKYWIVSKESEFASGSGGCEVGLEPTYEEVIVSCPCHSVCVKSAGAAASKGKGMVPLGNAQGAMKRWSSSWRGDQRIGNIRCGLADGISSGLPIQPLAQEVVTIRSDDNRIRGRLQEGERDYFGALDRVTAQLITEPWQTTS